MAKDNLRWIYQTASGQIKGPYTTAKLLERISEGRLFGTELVAEYPSGSWRSISKVSQFYEALLGTIDNNSASKSSSNESPEPLSTEKSEEVKLTDSNTEKDLEETSKPNFHYQGTSPNETEDSSSLEPKIPLGTDAKIFINEEGSTRIHKKKNKNRKSAETIDLLNFDQISQSERNKKSKFLLFGLFCVAISLFLLLGPESEKSDDKIVLLGPGRSNAKLTKNQLREKMSRAINSIELDEIETLVDAQNLLVSIIESETTNLEARGLLCLVHKELWPFSKQGASDLRVVNELSKTTRQVDISSPYGEVCEVVKLFVNGKYREVKGLLATALELENQFSLLPVLYFFKAESLEVEKDLTSAAAYYDQAGKIWEKWIAPKRELANIYRRQGRFQEAATILNWIIKRNSKHKAAKIELGILWHRSFKDKVRAFNYLSGALASSAKVSPVLESDGYLSLAELMLEKNDPKRAKEYAQRGYSLNPNNETIKQLFLRLGGNEKIIKENKINNELMFLGDQFARQGDYLAAQAEYKAAFEADPKNGTAAMRAAKCLWSLNQSFESIDWLRRAVKAEPKLIAAHVLLADYLSQKFDFEGARQVLANAITIEPGSYEIFKGLAGMELRRNNISTAITYAQKSLKIFDGDIETYIILGNANFALANNPTPASKKEIEMKEGAQRDALRYATKAIELDPTNAEAQISYANILAHTSGIEMAISYLKEKIKKFSYSTEYRIGLAKIYQSEDRFAQAKEIYTDVVEADPKNKKAFIGLGLCNKALGLNDLAIKNFLKAAVADPSDGEALFHAGILYLELNRSIEAISQFQRVQKVSPFFPKTNYYIGKAQFQMGNFKEALASALIEKKKNPELADAYILAAEVYEIQKQFAECAAEYSAAIKKRHLTSETFVRAAQCYRQSGSLDVAENMLEQALNLESGYAEIYKEQGALFEMRGDLRAAAASYNKYIGLAPNAKDRSEIENKINSLAGGH